MDPLATLRQYFGYEGFRSGQEEVITLILKRQSALALFPTGGGKSLCFQVPAMMLEGLTLVISPLIALMKDQVESLTARGIAAARLDSTLTRGESDTIFERLGKEEIRILYVAPERLQSTAFCEALAPTNIALFVVDEAHCISEWGHNFRPDYLRLARLARHWQVPRVLCLTATATPRVAGDIVEQFGIPKKHLVRAPLVRPKLELAVAPCEANDRETVLLQRLQTRPPGATVVYVTRQHTAERVATFLNRKGLSVRAYHAGMRDEDRAEIQDAFLSGELPIVVATIAFGMGIDKSDIRYVYHFNLPKSLEGYSQETGRAGRDGKPALCELLASGDDLTTLENFIHGDTPSRHSIRSLIDHLLRQGESFTVSLYDLSIACDIRQSVIKTLLTYLELSELIEPIGSSHSEYGVRWLRPTSVILSGHPPERQRQIRMVFALGKDSWGWRRYDLVEVSRELEITENEARQLFQDLKDYGDAMLRPGKLRLSFRLGSSTPEPRSLADQLYGRFLRFEEAELERLGDVVRFCQSTDCLPQQISSYFGDRIERCERCTNCSTPMLEERKLPGSERAKIEASDVALIRELFDERLPALRQPRQLARFLCGLISPAVRRARLDRDERFGSLEHVPFLDVLAHLDTM